MSLLQCSGRAKSFVLVVVVSASGCEDDAPRPIRCSDLAGSTQLPDVPLAYSTEHLGIHVDAGQVFCAGSAREYERFYQYVGAELGAKLPTHTPVFLLGHGVSDYCGGNYVGCRKEDGVVFSYPGYIFHELAHAATCEWRNGSSPYLREGLAVTFEPTPLIISSPKSWVDPREYITIGGERPNGKHYEPSGHLVRWLLEEYGPERFRLLYETSPRAGGEGVFDALAAVYGQKTDPPLSKYKKPAPYMWVPHRQCADLELLEPIDGAWTFNRIFDCEDPATLGPWERRGDETNFDSLAPSSMYQSFLIEIKTPGIYQFQRDLETSVEIERCIDEVALSEEQTDALWLQEGLFATLQGTTDIELPAGTYRVDVRRQYDEPHPVSLHIVPIG